MEPHVPKWIWRRWLFSWAKRNKYWNGNFEPSMLVSWFASEPLWPSTLSPMLQGEICWQIPPFCRLNPRFFRVQFPNLLIGWTVIKHPRIHTCNQYFSIFWIRFSIRLVGLKHVLLKHIETCQPFEKKNKQLRVSRNGSPKSSFSIRQWSTDH